MDRASSAPGLGAPSPRLLPAGRMACGREQGRRRDGGLVLAGLGPNGAACRSSDTALAGCAMSATKRALDRAQQARLRYEHAATSARHDRDAEISAAWLRFERNTAEA